MARTSFDKTSIMVFVAIASLFFALMTFNTAVAADIKVLSVNSIRPALDILAPNFERTTGHKLTIEYAAGVVARRVQDGEIGDVIIANRQGIERLEKGGKLVAGSTVVIARTGIGVAVRTGAHKPDISSPATLKQTLLAAKSISYSDPSLNLASGIHVAKVLDRLGIANEMRTKTVFPKPPMIAGNFVAIGKAEIGIAQIQELMTISGIDIVGPLPADLQDTIIFLAAIMGTAKQADAGRTLINFLRTPEAAVVIRAKGLEPG